MCICIYIYSSELPLHQLYLEQGVCKTKWGSTTTYPSAAASFSLDYTQHSYPKEKPIYLSAHPAYTPPQPPTLVVWGRR